MQKQTARFILETVLILIANFSTSLPTLICTLNPSVRSRLRCCSHCL